jgi:hypothetical protein
VLLAVIGSNWLDARDEHGNRRLDNPNDFVRIEIAVLQRNIPVIPILLDGATIPKATQLPEDLQELALCNAMEIRHASFHDDMNRLIRGLKGQSDQAGAVEGVHLAGEGASDFPTKTHVSQSKLKGTDGLLGSYVTSIISRFSVGSEAGSSLRRGDFRRRLSISAPLRSLQK